MHVDGGSYCSRRWWRQLLQQTTLLCLGTQDAEHVDAVPGGAICREETASPLEAGCVAEGGVAERSGVGGAKLFEAGTRKDGDDDEEDGAEQRLEESRWRCQLRKKTGGDDEAGDSTCNCYESVTSRAWAHKTPPDFARHAFQES